jgi:hypothetical protein
MDVFGDIRKTAKMSKHRESSVDEAEHKDIVHFEGIRHIDEFLENDEEETESDLNG